ncbi:hypothetical protein F5887DRAFT_1165333 [Amanita rubescens]|nr:hypothetical protein F5887DRAFT_1165333 [Amanita rubescens]
MFSQRSTSCATVDLLDEHLNHVFQLTSTSGADIQTVILPSVNMMLRRPPGLGVMDIYCLHRISFHPPNAIVNDFPMAATVALGMILILRTVAVASTLFYIETSNFIFPLFLNIALLIHAFRSLVFFSLLYGLPAFNDGPRRSFTSTVVLPTMKRLTVLGTKIASQHLQMLAAIIIVINDVRVVSSFCGVSILFLTQGQSTQTKDQGNVRKMRRKSYDENQNQVVLTLNVVALHTVSEIKEIRLRQSFRSRRRIGISDD